MSSGTSILLSKSGPVGLRTITKMLQNIKEKLWEHPGKYNLWKYVTREIEKIEHACTQVFETLTS